MQLGGSHFSQLQVPRGGGTFSVQQAWPEAVPASALSHIARAKIIAAFAHSSGDSTRLQLKEDGSPNRPPNKLVHRRTPIARAPVFFGGRSLGGPVGRNSQICGQSEHQSMGQPTVSASRTRADTCSWSCRPCAMHGPLCYGPSMDRRALHMAVLWRLM